MSEARQKEKEAEKPRPVTLKMRLTAGVLSGVARAISATVRLQVHGRDAMEQVVHQHQGAIFVSWHGRSLLAAREMYGRGYIALVSLSKDGDIQTLNFQHFGFKVVRGSTGRGGVRATREILDLLKAGGVLAFTPDGPRGPSQKVQPGVIYFAQKSGKPIIPIGISAAPSWTLSTWDRYQIPKPLARAAWIYGEPLWVGADESQEAACQRVEEAINALEAQATSFVLKPH